MIERSTFPFVSWVDAAGELDSGAGFVERTGVRHRELYTFPSPYGASRYHGMAVL